MLFYVMTTLHVLVCVILVMVVLLQSGKGADLAGAFGGGATQTAFGSRGPASFLSRMTTVAAVVFMLTSIGLALISTKTQPRSILETTGTSRPARQAPAADKPASGQSLPSQEEIQRKLEELQKQNQEKTAPAEQPSK